jgi:hypothetical protein
MLKRPATGFIQRLLTLHRPAQRRLPASGLIAAEIIEDLEAALEHFRLVAEEPGPRD